MEGRFFFQKRVWYLNFNVHVLVGEIVVDFHVLANEVSGLNNITITTCLHSLPLAKVPGSYLDHYLTN